METIKTISKKDVFTGATAKNDFARYGKVDLTFYVQENQIGVSVAGFSSSLVYKFSATSTKDLFNNTLFVDRYVRHVEDKEKIFNLIASKLPKE